MPISRRTVIAAAAAAPLARALAANAQPLPPEPVPEDQKIGFAIVGLGGFSMGQMLPSFKVTKWCKPAALVTGDPDTKGKKVAEQYGIPQDRVMTYEQMGRLADMDDVKVVYIATPTGLHKRDTLAGFAAGKHVLCEKPMASSVAECDEMIAAGERAGKKLMIAYRVRYEPFNQTAIRYAREEKFGPVRMVNGQIAFKMGGKGKSWRSDPSLNGGGGPLMDLGIYTVQAQRYITGEEPGSVTATTYRPEDDPRFPEGVEARCNWTFGFPSGATASGATAWDADGGNRYRVTCRDDWYELDPATSYTGKRLFVGRELQTDLKQANEFAAELDHMAECVKQDKEPLTPGEEGRRDVVAMKAIYEAAETGQTVRLDAAPATRRD